MTGRQAAADTGDSGSSPVSEAPAYAGANGSAPVSAVTFDGVTKRFPGVVALDDVSIEVFRGEVHALLGENGAGKSTLIKILTGVYRADGGRVFVNGEQARLSDPHDAQRCGIALVPQDVLVVPQLSIGRNILLGREAGRARRSALSRAEREVTEAALARVGADFPASTRAGLLSVPQLRLAQIARALTTDCTVLVLDEPTAALNEHDGEILLERVERARAEGKAVLYVTHRLSEVMRLADRVSVLRDGRIVGRIPRGEMTRETIVDLLTKTTQPTRRADVSRTQRRAADGTVLCVREMSDGQCLHEVSLELSAGQILGVAGLQGSGHGHLLKAIAGLVPATGSIEVDGKACPLGKPAASFRRGVILVPADRRNAAIVGSLSIRDNISLSNRVRRPARRLGLRWPRLERQMASEYVNKLSIRPAGVRTRVAVLSGGNQQKVALSRALEGNARVLLVEEPTQGIDIDSKAEIRQLLREFAATGRAVLVATSEFEELIGLADEAVVLCKGRVAGRLSGDAITYRNVLSHALS